MANFNVWIVRNKWGSFLLWTLASTRKEVRRKICDWKGWAKKGHKIIKARLVIKEE